MTREALNEAIELDRSISNFEERMKRIINATNLLCKVKNEGIDLDRVNVGVPDGNKNILIQVTPQTAIEALRIELAKLEKERDRMENKFKEL